MKQTNHFYKWVNIFKPEIFIAETFLANLPVDETLVTMFLESYTNRGKILRHSRCTDFRTAFTPRRG